MYEELVKQCRGCLDSLCGECKYEHLQKAGNFVPCMNALLGEAANAIEKLQEDSVPIDDMEMILSEVAKPQWIPVTERLPSPTFAREWYLVALESGCVQTLAFEKGGYSFEFDKDGFSDNLFQPGWHETASPVTHWMRLPEPPKEET